MTLAQLIKLEDYVSRYEWDLYRYSSQYIKLKKDRWKELHNEWKLAKETSLFDDEPEQFIEEEQPKVHRWNIFKRKQQKKITSETLMQETETTKSSMHHKLSIMNEMDLKQHFLNELLPFQLKWATSTLSRVSNVDSKYQNHPHLKYFLQRFPDTYFLMYRPVFDIQNATVEADIILINPIGIEIISLIDLPKGYTIMAGDERTWHVEADNSEERILNPSISLRRTEKLIHSMLAKDAIEFPINKTILSRSNQIIFATEPYKTNIIDRTSYPTWFDERKRLRSPIKNIQLKAADAILKYCQTDAVSRPEWDQAEKYVTIEQKEEDE